ncbi:glucocorticoid-induced transcript 1 protein-like isoform X2 [Ovis aries]|uniref:glucocorticoid-induced transcript 1 protein-like isoform X2 n=1 Tax=Ovis aries TaxID=9940 RepID=UPI001C2EC995|nr:glucocorticoid-induced transcript 1 protein-like isoform X2 [Ovis aries]
MRSSQPPSPYLEAHLEAAPSWGLEASLSRASARAAEWVRGAPPGAPGRRRRSGGRSVPGIPGGGSVPAGQVRGGARAFPARDPSPGARCGPYQVLRSEALHLALRAGGRALGALAEPAAGRLGARRPTGKKGRSAAPRQPPSATDFALCAILSGPRPPRAPGAARVHPPIRASPRAPAPRPGLFAARLNHHAVRLPTCPCSPLKREVPAGLATTLRAPRWGLISVRPRRQQEIESLRKPLPRAGHGGMPNYIYMANRNFLKIHFLEQ